MTLKGRVFTPPETLRRKTLVALMDIGIRTEEDLARVTGFDHEDVCGGINLLFRDGMVETVVAGEYRLTAKGKAYCQSHFNDLQNAIGD